MGVEKLNILDILIARVFNPGVCGNVKQKKESLLTFLIF